MITFDINQPPLFLHLHGVSGRTFDPLPLRILESVAIGHTTLNG